jgi:hypothetical protein
LTRKLSLAALKAPPFVDKAAPRLRRQHRPVHGEVVLESRHQDLGEEQLERPPRVFGQTAAG